MYCSLEIFRQWLFMCIDRWVIGDLITAYVHSAGESTGDKQEGTLSPPERLLAVDLHL